MKQSKNFQLSETIIIYEAVHRLRIWNNLEVVYKDEEEWEDDETGDIYER